MQETQREIPEESGVVLEPSSLHLMPSALMMYKFGSPSLLMRWKGNHWSTQQHLAEEGLPMKGFSDLYKGKSGKN